MKYLLLKQANNFSVNDRRLTVKTTAIAARPTTKHIMIIMLNKEKNVSCKLKK